MSEQSVAPTVEKVKPMSTPLLVDLRASLEAAAVTWVLAQADRDLKGRPALEKLTDLHHAERRKYEDAALAALLSLNRDAELYAEQAATNVAFEIFARFVTDRNLDWLDETHPANVDDALEVLINRIALAAIHRARQVLCGTYPGLSQHLTRLQHPEEPERNSAVHPLMRDLVNLTSAVYGVPGPKDGGR